jgi:hypothetical protein
MTPILGRSLAGLLLVVAPEPVAAAEDEEKETVEVAVIAILASDTKDKIDPQLACIAKQVRKKHKELKGFRLATLTRKSLAIGARGSFDLIDEKVAVTVLRGADEKNRVQVKVGPPRMGEITYDTCCGKFLPIVTPVRTKDKELLILAVCVRTCHEK